MNTILAPQPRRMYKPLSGPYLSTQLYKRSPYRPTMSSLQSFEENLLYRTTPFLLLGSQRRCF